MSTSLAASSHRTVQTVWKAVPGYEGFYEASRDGRIRSIERLIRQRGQSTRIINGKDLPGYPDDDGYLHVTLCKAGNRKRVLLHRIILSTFIPEPEGGALALHKDDVKTHNAVDNLYWGNQSQNQFDAFANGGRVLPDECVQGHPFSPENTYYSPGAPNKRRCRQCMLDANRRIKGVKKPRRESYVS